MGISGSHNDNFPSLSVSHRVSPKSMFNELKEGAGAGIVNDMEDNCPCSFSVSSGPVHA